MGGGQLLRQCGQLLAVLHVQRLDLPLQTSEINEREGKQTDLHHERFVLAAAEFLPQASGLVGLLFGVGDSLHEIVDLLRLLLAPLPPHVPVPGEELHVILNDEVAKGKRERTHGQLFTLLVLLTDELLELLHLLLRLLRFGLQLLQFALVLGANFLQLLL